MANLFVFFVLFFVFFPSLVRYFFVCWYCSSSSSSLLKLRRAGDEEVEICASETPRVWFFFLRLSYLHYTSYILTFNSCCCCFFCFVMENATKHNKKPKFVVFCFFFFLLLRYVYVYVCMFLFSSSSSFFLLTIEKWANNKSRLSSLDRLFRKAEMTKLRKIWVWYGFAVVAFRSFARSFRLVSFVVYYSKQENTTKIYFHLNSPSSFFFSLVFC